ncbi:phage-related baseplate assembly protein [Sinobacterium caligoides]|uniref:Phage-related baseplate assembly protein n=1 Tax=Sinobacterium caligoides TaxID=933926 RepID=A0A3N2E0Q3_9GAMM|nr:baseplate J/gp47 family protein [Sinobacterium caligoides]ROS05676.1 phage-related baseplate assembly protein [Sinobacterium caligoides]
MNEFNAIDLSGIPAPDIVETLDYEDVFRSIKDQFDDIYPDISVDSLYESEPIIKLLELFAYREMYLRARINEAVRQVMLTTATGTNLENLAALVGVERRVLIPEDADSSPPVMAIYEDDESLRKNTLYAFEGASTAGPRGAYIAHAKYADARVKDVYVDSLKEGEVTVWVLSREDNGLPKQEILDAVVNQLNDDDVRPITDKVNVLPATVKDFKLDAELYFNPGINVEEVLTRSKSAVSEYLDDQQFLGRPITIAGLYAALYRPGVSNVLLKSPAADCLVSASEALYCDYSSKESFSIVAGV